MKGRGLHAKPAQVMAVLRCRRNLRLAVGHLPSEANDDADCLSRVSAPADQAKVLPVRLAATQQAQVTPPLELWKLVD